MHTYTCPYIYAKIHKYIHIHPTLIQREVGRIEEGPLETMDLRDSYIPGKTKL